MFYTIIGVTMSSKKKRPPSPNIRVHGPLLTRLKRAAEKDGRKVNAMAVRVLDKGLPA